MRQLRFTVTGIAPLLMRNGTLGRPINKHYQELKQLRSKSTPTDKEQEQIARLEFFGNLYIDEGVIGIPGENIQQSLLEAVTTREIRSAKGNLYCMGFFPLIYAGPKDPEQLWDQEKFRDYREVSERGRRIYRCRPRFRDWKLDFTVGYRQPLDVPIIRGLVEHIGSKIGWGDYRPKYGRFEIESLREI